MLRPPNWITAVQGGEAHFFAGSRLDVQMGMLWHHLDRRVEFEVSRKAQGGNIVIASDAWRINA
jgi:hypothetical protein